MDDGDLLSKDDRNLGSGPIASRKARVSSMIEAHCDLWGRRGSLLSLISFAHI